MQFFFKKSKKLNEILQRSEMNDEEFIQKMHLSDDLAIKTVICVRTELGNFFTVSPTKLYPDDKFRKKNKQFSGIDYFAFVSSLVCQSVV